MKQVIIIATTPQRYDFLQNLLETLNGYDKYPIIIMSDYNYFTGKMKEIIFHTDIDEFTLIADSMEIKDASLFDIMFEKHKGRSVSIFKTPQIYHMSLGKFKSEILRKLPIEFTVSTFADDDAIAQNIGHEYIQFDPDIAYVLTDKDEWQNNRFEDKFGRKNMVIENKYFVKYKGHWSRETLPVGHVTRT